MPMPRVTNPFQSYGEAPRPMPFNRRSFEIKRFSTAELPFMVPYNWSEADTLMTGASAANIAETDAGIDFGLTEGTMARLRNARGEFLAWNERNIAATAVMQRELATELQRELANEFSSHDTTSEGIRRFPIEQHGPFFSTIRLLGTGTILVETGTMPHPIFPQNSVLRFEGRYGDIVFAPSVDHPGMARDPFVERAQAKVNVDLRLRQMYLGPMQQLFFEPRNIP